MKTLITNSILLILGFGFTAIAWAQDSPDTKTESEVKIKIITSVNGDTKVVEKTLKGDEVFMMEELNDSFPEIKAMTKVFSDSPSVFTYNYSFDLEKEMKKLGEEMEKLGKNFEFEWNSEEFEKEMEKAGVEMERAMKELSKTIVIDGDEIRTLSNDDENVTVSENGDTIKISVKKDVRIGDNNAKGTDGKKVKVIVIEEESDGKEGEEPEIKVIKKVIKSDVKSQSTGMEEADKAQTLRVFPNPSNGKIAVNFKPDSKKKTQLKITDESGKVVYSEEIKTATEFTHEIDLGNEAKGIYFVELVQGKNKYVNRIVLK